MSKSVFVTGGNAGIGLALCKQLVAEHKCRVFLGARSSKKGEEAVLKILKNTPEGKVSFVLCDTTNDAEVVAAAATVARELGGGKLFGLVNNAGTGLSHGVGFKAMIDTNYHGAKRVCEAFLPLLGKDARIVNVGSGAGPSFVSNLTAKDQKNLFTSWKTTQSELDTAVVKHASSYSDPKKDGWAAYGLSKAALTVYTMLLATRLEEAKTNVVVSCVTPGFIDTAITKGFGATKTAEEGTVSIKHCLLDALPGSGFYYGSDGVRSPLHFMRNPGEPAYDGGEIDWDKA